MTYKEISLTRYKKYLLPVVILLGLLYGSAILCGVSMGKLVTGAYTSLAFLGSMFPPDWSAFPEMVEPAIKSILIAFLGTVFGVLFSLVLALLAASNISYRWLRSVTRFLIGTERSLPEIVILLLLVAAFGLGPMPGIIALSIGCIGMLGKLFADTIEEIEPSMIEAMQSVGANKLQIIWFGVVPQIMPSIISFALFRFEINIRLSVILGAVGAGGIGYELDYAFNLLEYHRALTALIIILVLVFGTEQISVALRNNIKEGGALK